MAYLVEVKSHVERSASIASAIASTSDRERFNFRGRVEDLPRVRLPNGLPVYRMENFRTRVRQSEYVRKNKAPGDFFANGQESEDAQQAQHDILFEIAKSGRGLSVVPIIDVLRKEDQNERLVITSTGVVVNGNRRLAAMRELFTEDSSAYGRYQWVDCIVLPGDARPEELRELEVRLQMRPETRLPYDWVCECLAIRDLEKSGISRDKIAEMMNQSRAIINRKAAALDHAEIYLSEWVGKPREYTLIERGEQIFGEMAKSLEKRSGDQLELGRSMGFFIFENVADFEDRAYEYRSAFGSNVEKVAATVGKNMGVDLSATAAQPQKTLDLAVDLDDDKSAFVDVKKLVPLLKDKGKAKQVAEEIKTACQIVAGAESEDKAGLKALGLVRSAARTLTQVDLGIANSSTYGEIEQLLDEIQANARALADKLRKLAKKSRH